MPITATVMAVRAAMGLKAWSAEEELIKNAIKATSETKITAVPNAKFFWLNFFLASPN
jgi:hypothetical protein